MGAYTVIPTDTFENLQTDTGVMLYKFKPSEPSTVKDSDIICATTGGIKISCSPEYSDLGEDIDNCPVNMKELKHLDSWEATIEFTSLDAKKADTIKLAFGAADIDGNKITPRKSLKTSDFKDVWWAGDRMDGGVIAVQLKNALSTDGFSLETNKNENGQLSCTLTGHVSINAQDEMPMVVYSIDPTNTSNSSTATGSDTGSSTGGTTTGGTTAG